MDTAVLWIPLHSMRQAMGETNIKKGDKHKKCMRKQHHVDAKNWLGPINMRAQLMVPVEAYASERTRGYS